MSEENLEKKSKNKGLRGTLGSAREKVGGSLDKVSGKAFRRQFEQFTSIVETTVIGVHRDQQEMNKRFEKLEQSANVVETTVAGIHKDQLELNKRLEELEHPKAPPAPPIRKQVGTVFVLAIIAVILAVVALRMVL